MFYSMAIVGVKGLEQSRAGTFESEDEDGRFGRRVAVDDADLDLVVDAPTSTWWSRRSSLDLVVDADVDSLLTSSSASTPTADGRAPLARDLPDGGVHSTHARSS